MKTIRSKSGFSLIELLTVIAIIAILAGIIFPVMTTVKKKSNLTKCMANLHDVGMAMKLYQQDNRKYPGAIAGHVQTPGGTVTPLDQLKNDGSNDGLYPEYIKSVNAFHCPLSSIKSMTATVDVNGTKYYAYSSYDIYSTAIDSTGETTGAPADVRYNPNWAPDMSFVSLYNVPAGATDANDFKRQLRFRNPSGDTVVTWCSFHSAGKTTEMLPVLFLDGHCDTFTADKVEGTSSTVGWRYRTLPKR